MNSYVNNIVIAATLFPVVAALITLPYLIYQYRKYGSIPFWKTFVCYTFVFYLLCAYFMIILPLPECKVAAECGAVSKVPSLVPFKFVSEFIQAAITTQLSLNPHTWLAFLKQSSVYCTLFNLLLTVPLGFYARYLFNFSWWKALILGFCVSLFYEISQLTGLFGIYDYAYRLFDVDDLIVNTAGCVLGCALALPFVKILPDFKSLNAKALVKGARMASFTRRLAGFAIDFIVSFVVAFAVDAVLANRIIPLQSLLVFFVCCVVFFMVVPTITKGQTLGQKVVKLRIYRMDGQSASAARYVVRYGLLFFLIIGPPLLLEAMPTDLDDVAQWTIAIGFLSGYGVWAISVLVRAVRSALGHPFILITGVISDTTVMTEGQAAALRSGKSLAGEHAKVEASSEGL